MADVWSAIGLLATINERAIEYLIAPLFDKVPGLKPLAWTQVYIQLIGGLIFAFGTNFNAAAALIPQFPLVPAAGIALTGLAIGGGSEIFHQAVNRLTPAASAPVIEEGVG